MAKQRRLSQEDRVGPKNTSQQQLPAEAFYTNRRKVLQGLSMPLGTHPTSNPGSPLPESKLRLLLLSGHTCLAEAASKAPAPNTGAVFLLWALANTLTFSGLQVFYLFLGFICVCMCASVEVPLEARSVGSPWNWSYSWL